MFKMGCSMAKKILAIDGKSASTSADAGSGSSKKAKDKQLAQEPSSAVGVGKTKTSGDELNDFSKLEADPRVPLNVRQIFKITKSWKAIARTMSKTGTAMFLNLFEQNQDLFYLFHRFQHLKGTDLHESMELREHASTVMATLDQSINALSDYDNFVTYLHSIGKLHRKVPGFRRDHFWKIEQPFLKAVKQTLDERCNEVIEEIYKIAIKLIIETIAEGYGEDSPSNSEQPPSAGAPGAGAGSGSGGYSSAPGRQHDSNSGTSNGANRTGGGGNSSLAPGAHGPGNGGGGGSSTRSGAPSDQGGVVCCDYLTSLASVSDRADNKSRLRQTGTGTGQSMAAAGRRINPLGAAQVGQFCEQADEQLLVAGGRRRIKPVVDGDGNGSAEFAHLNGMGELDGEEELASFAKTTTTIPAKTRDEDAARTPATGSRQQRLATPTERPDGDGPSNEIGLQGTLTVLRELLLTLTVRGDLADQNGPRTRPGANKKKRRRFGKTTMASKRACSRNWLAEEQRYNDLPASARYNERGELEHGDGGARVADCLTGAGTNWKPAQNNASSHSGRRNLRGFNLRSNDERRETKADTYGNGSASRCAAAIAAAAAAEAATHADYNNNDNHQRGCKIALVARSHRSWAPPGGLNTSRAVGLMGGQPSDDLGGVLGFELAKKESDNRNESGCSAYHPLLGAGKRLDKRQSSLGIAGRQVNSSLGPICSRPGETGGGGGGCLATRCPKRPAEPRLDLSGSFEGLSLFCEPKASSCIVPPMKPPGSGAGGLFTSEGTMDLPGDVPLAHNGAGSPPEGSSAATRAFGDNGTAEGRFRGLDSGEAVAKGAHIVSWKQRYSHHAETLSAGAANVSQIKQSSSPVPSGNEQIISHCAPSQGARSKHNLDWPTISSVSEQESDGSQFSYTTNGRCRKRGQSNNGGDDASGCNSPPANRSPPTPILASSNEAAATTITSKSRSSKHKFPLTSDLNDLVELIKMLMLTVASRRAGANDNHLTTSTSSTSTTMPRDEGYVIGTLR